MAKARSTTKKKARTATKTHTDRDGTVLNVETNLLIASKSIMESLLDAKKETQKKVRKINDVFGVKFSKAETSEHVHKGAANIFFNLAGLDDEELHRTLFHLLFYIRDGGLLDRAKKQEELFTAGETGPAPKLRTEGEKDEGDEEVDETEHPDEAEANGGNVVALGTAAREVADKAGSTH